ncbi:MAG TPA: tRNA guanosine(34) transglycosylase Tgt [Gammaproteobacteria bacterium]|nr:tRNA guanosine(34) transglycosylase Tgt [Gammaproteobacteria bacterium]
MQNIFKTELVKQHAAMPARITQITTPHGEILTPAFMPVGTRAFVNCMTPVDLVNAGSQIILGGNTYHMLCAPGTEIIQNAGGMHKFMDWNKPMLTDSGGFQVFSLSKNGKICKIDAKGAHFKHPISGQVIHLTPQSSIQTQKIIGADIIMAFDECTPENGGREAALQAMERTHRWLAESIGEHQKNPQSAYGYKQALFGIIQGGSFPDLREQSTRFILDADLDGIAIGGEVIGFDMQKTLEVIDWVRPMLPDNKTRYTMGVGLNPQDLIDAAAKGIDIFDCVAPTRNARHGSLYCGEIVEENNWVRFQHHEEKGKILIKKSIYAKDNRPIMETCACYTCKSFTRSYLHFLFKQQSLAYNNLACIHNIHVMQDVCEKMRKLIKDSQ